MEKAKSELTVLDALRLAIDALNCVPSFATSTQNPEKPGRTLTSYELLPMLEKAAGQQLCGATDSDMNRAVLVGRLAADPDIREFRHDGRTASLIVVTSDNSTAAERHRISVLSESLITIVERELRKGSRVHIVGSLQTRNWVDRKNIERYSTEIILRDAGDVLILLPQHPVTPKRSRRRDASCDL